MPTVSELSDRGHRSSIGEKVPDTNPSSKAPTRIPELNGIRGIAIAMVLVWHFFALTNTAGRFVFTSERSG